ncbi:hypothetical protein EK904_013449, partial [Melospiza melodia maxima]
MQLVMVKEEGWQKNKPEVGAQGEMRQGMLRNIARDQVEDTELFLHFAVNVSVFCRQHGWSCVAHLNWCLMHVPVVYPEAEQSLVAVARIKTGSEGGILLCANCTRRLLNLQSPSKQRIHCGRLKDIRFCQAGRKGSRGSPENPLKFCCVSLTALLQIWTNSDFHFSSIKVIFLLIEAFGGVFYQRSCQVLPLCATEGREGQTSSGGVLGIESPFQPVFQGSCHYSHRILLPQFLLPQCWEKAVCINLPGFISKTSIALYVQKGWSKLSFRGGRWHCFCATTLPGNKGERFRRNGPVSQRGAATLGSFLIEQGHITCSPHNGDDRQGVCLQGKAAPRSSKLNTFTPALCPQPGNSTLKIQIAEQPGMGLEAQHLAAENLCSPDCQSSLNALCLSRNSYLTTHVCVLGHLDPWDLQGCVFGRSCLTSFAALLPFGKHKCYSKPLLFQNMLSVITVSRDSGEGSISMVSLAREQQPSSAKSLGGPKATTFLPDLGSSSTCQTVFSEKPESISLTPGELYIKLAMVWQSPELTPVWLLANLPDTPAEKPRMASGKRHNVSHFLCLGKFRFRAGNSRLELAFKEPTNATPKHTRKSQKKHILSLSKEIHVPMRTNLSGFSWAGEVLQSLHCCLCDFQVSHAHLLSAPVQYHKQCNSKMGLMDEDWRIGGKEGIGAELPGRASPAPCPKQSRVCAVRGCCSSWLWSQLCSAICTAHIADLKSFSEKLGVGIVCRRDKGSKVKEVSHKPQEKLLLLSNVLAKLILNDQSSTSFNVQLLYMAAELEEACGMGVQLMLRLIAEAYMLKSSGIFPDLWLFSQCPLCCLSLEVPSRT